MKKLNSALVTGSDKSAQILKQLAEAIQDVGGEPDRDMFRIAQDEELAKEIAKVVMRSLFVPLITIHVKSGPDGSLLHDIVNTIPIGTAKGDSEMRQKVLATLPCTLVKIERDYTLIGLKRGYMFADLLPLLNNIGLFIALSHEFVYCIPYIREYIGAHKLELGCWLSCYCLSLNNNCCGLVFHTQPLKRGSNELIESIRFWDNISVGTSCSDFLLIKGKV